jgi:hypothetical protein
MMNRQREFNPQAFRVFGPKVVAMRKGYEDPALESRFLTEVMGRTKLRAGIPINLPAGLKEDALRLRNRLLLFRFRNRHAAGVHEDAPVAGLAPRGSQILLPLLSIVDDERVRSTMVAFATAAQDSTTVERGLSTEAQVLEIVRELSGEAHKQAIPLIEIAQRFAVRFTAEYERPIAPRWIGTILRQRLHLAPYKSHGRFLLAVHDNHQLDQLYERYGLAADEEQAAIPGQ